MSSTEGWLTGKPIKAIRWSLNQFYFPSDPHWNFIVDASIQWPGCMSHVIKRMHLLWNFSERLQDWDHVLTMYGLHRERLTLLCRVPWNRGLMHLLKEKVSTHVSLLNPRRLTWIETFCHWWILSACKDHSTSWFNLLFNRTEMLSKDDSLSPRDLDLWPTWIKPSNGTSTY